MVWNYDIRTIGVVGVDLKVNDTSVNEQPFWKGLFSKDDSNFCRNYKNFFRSDKIDPLHELNPQSGGLVHTMFDA